MNFQEFPPKKGFVEYTYRTYISNERISNRAFRLNGQILFLFLMYVRDHHLKQQDALSEALYMFVKSNAAPTYLEETKIILDDGTDV
jgi:hypothetical protein